MAQDKSTPVTEYPENQPFWAPRNTVAALCPCQSTWPATVCMKLACVCMHALGMPVEPEV